jgi:diguanylate cyclase (GGDEF)-like protein
VAEEVRPGSLAARLSEGAATVLVVEDEPDIVAFLGAYFRASGTGLEHVDPASVDDVERAIAAHRPVCILLDLHLRGLSGLDVYRAIRANPEHALLPVVIVTADSRTSVKEEALSGGVDAFVTKPFNVKNLFTLVQDRAARAASRAEVVSSPSTADAVTGVATHGWVRDRLADEIVLAGRTATPASFALVRVRSLADTNRELGYGAGDIVLRAVADRLRSSLPSSAVLGRNAGAEFAVVLPGIAVADAERIVRGALDVACADVPLPARGDGVAVPVRVAAGVAAYPAHGANADEIYMAADVALADACDRAADVAIAR